MQTPYQLTNEEIEALCKKYFPFAEYEKKLSECRAMIEQLEKRVADDEELISRCLKTIEKQQKEISELKTLSSTPQAAPVVQQQTAVVKQAAPVVHQNTAVAKQAAPVVHQNTAIVKPAVKPGSAPKKATPEKFFKTGYIGGKFAVTGYTGQDKDVIIPEKIGDHEVKLIGDRAFQKQTVTSITVPDSVTTIGNEAFRSCHLLTSITIPNSVTTIGNAAFRTCTSLTSITIPYIVTTIGNAAFQSCRSLTSITIPKSVTTIGYDTFFDCCERLTIIAPKRSYAAQYAIENKMRLRYSK